MCSLAAFTAFQVLVDRDCQQLLFVVLMEKIKLLLFWAPLHNKLLTENAQRMIKVLREQRGVTLK